MAATVPAVGPNDRRQEGQLAQEHHSAAPVLDHRGKLDAGVTMIGGSGSFDMTLDGAVANELRDAIAVAQRS